MFVKETHIEKKNAGFERANVSWVHVENENTFDVKIGYLMLYFVVF